MAEKITKKQYFEEMITILTDANREDLVAVLEKEIQALDKKAIKDKERKAAKKAEDPLKDRVLAIVTEEKEISGEDIVKEINDEDVTKAKVVARLTKLVKEGIVDKAVKNIDKRRITVYKLVTDEEATETAEE
jgi:DNA-binding MarR family transcriptional regulator